MACHVRYLNSTGIMRREIPGVDRLASAYPKEWLMYASLNCYPRGQSPMEIDLLVVMEDRVLLMELKDWNGNLTQQGDRWFINGQNRGRSAVIAVEEKAKKLKAVFQSAIPALAGLWIDFRVVLTASATSKHLPDEHKPFVWNLTQAASIADTRQKSTLLRPLQIRLMKLNLFENEFDRVTGNPKVFQPLEADWGGYHVVEQDIAVHPNSIWREHRAERNGEPRIKSLVRIWAFDRLPPTLNSPDRREFVANRELKAIAHLTAMGSSLIERNSVLSDISPVRNEILTQHFELRSLLADWVTLDRFLERNRDDLDSDDRLTIATALLTIVAELHRHDISHRDIGLRNLWVGSSTKMAITGFMSAQLPEQETISDWLSILRGYSLPIPEDQAPGRKSTGFQKDVYLLGRLLATILDAKATPDDDTSIELSEDFLDFGDLLRSATAADPQGRYKSAVLLAEDFGRIADKRGRPEIDQSMLDRFETKDIPYLKWPQHAILAQDVQRVVYKSVNGAGTEVVVKTWNRVMRGLDSATDLALVRLFDTVSRVAATPVAGLPRFESFGLSPTGPFVVYRHEPGVPFDEIRPTDAEQTLTICINLLSAIDLLHELGCSHGDVSPKNVICDFKSNAVCIIDACDFSAIGDGSVRTPAWCPDNWAQLSTQCLDRYAVAKMSLELCKTTQDNRLSTATSILASELCRPSIETLEPSLNSMRNCLTQIRRPAAPGFVLTAPNAKQFLFKPDGDGYFVSYRTFKSGEARLSLSGTDTELIFSIQEDRLKDWQIRNVYFSSLDGISRHGEHVPLTLDLIEGPSTGFEELFEYLIKKAGPLSAPAGEPVGSAAPHLDIARYWRRLMDLESDDRLEVEITGELAYREDLTIYSFRSLGRSFDFDPEDIVDVYIPPNKRIGELDHGLSDSRNTLAIRFGTRRLTEGDTIFLVDRREQTSLDRRAKAIQRVLETGQCQVLRAFQPTSSFSRKVDNSIDKSIHRWVSSFMRS